jgi:hypothetical protein
MAGVLLHRLDLLIPLSLRAQVTGLLVTLRLALLVP